MSVIWLVSYKKHLSAPPIFLFCWVRWSVLLVCLVICFACIRSVLILLLPVFLDCLSLIVPSAFCNVYLRLILFYSDHLTTWSYKLHINMIHVHGVVYAMQHCLIRPVSDLPQVLRFSLPTIITSATLLKYSWNRRFVISHQTKTYFRLQKCVWQLTTFIT